MLNILKRDKRVFVGVVNKFKDYLALYLGDDLVIHKSQNEIDRMLVHLKIGKNRNKFGTEIKRDRAKCMIMISQSYYR